MGELFRVVRRAAVRAVRIYFAPITWVASRAAAGRRPQTPPRPGVTARLGEGAVDRRL